MPFCNDGRWHHTQAEADACTKHRDISDFDTLSTYSRVAARLNQGAQAAAPPQQLPAVAPPPVVLAPIALAPPGPPQPGVPQQGPMHRGPPQPGPLHPSSPRPGSGPPASTSDDSDPIDENPQERAQDETNDNPQSDASRSPPPGPPPPPSTASAGSRIGGWFLGMPSSPDPADTEEQAEADKLNAVSDAILPVEQQMAQARERERQARLDVPMAGPESLEHHAWYQRRGIHVAVGIFAFLWFFWWYYHYVLYEAETRHLQRALRRRAERDR